MSTDFFFESFMLVKALELHGFVFRCVPTQQTYNGRILQRLKLASQSKKYTSSPLMEWRTVQLQLNTDKLICENICKHIFGLVRTYPKAQLVMPCSGRTQQTCFDFIFIVICMFVYYCAYDLQEGKGRGKFKRWPFLFTARDF